MNRIFHARVPWYAFVLLILLSVVVVWSYWERIGLLAAVALLMMVFVVERVIHTSYTITTDGMLIVNRGRFSSRIVVPLTSIRSIERINGVRLGSVCLKRYLLLHYAEGGEKTMALIPVKENEMVDYIIKQRDKVTETISQEQES